MNLKLNRSKISLQATNIASSLVFYLYYKNQQKYIKSFNSIKATHFDPVVKDHISIVSNGFKKNLVFKKQECNEANLQNNINSFVSYFFDLDDDLFRFSISPTKYFRELTVHYLKNQKIVFRIKGKLDNLKKTKINSKKKINKKLIKNFLFTLNYKRDPISSNYNKIILVKAMYLKLYFLTNRGVVVNLSKKFTDKALLSKLNYIFKGFIKDTFKYIILLNYLLINFFSNIILNSHQNQNLLYNIIIYYYFLKFLNFTFFDYLKEKRLKFRKKNKLLRKYGYFTKLKLSKTIKLYYFFAIKYYTISLNSANWIKNTVFNLNNFIFNSKTEGVEQCILLNKINFLSTKERFSAFIFIYNIIKSFLSFEYLDYNNNLKQFHKYIHLKTIFAQTYLNSYFADIKYLFKQNYYSNIYDLCFFKINAILTDVYSTEAFIFFQKTLYWSNIWNSKNNFFKTIQRRRLNLLEILHPVKKVNKVSIKNKKIKLDFKNLILGFDRLKNEYFNLLKIKNIRKIKTIRALKIKRKFKILFLRFRKQFPRKYRKRSKKKILLYKILKFEKIIYKKTIKKIKFINCILNSLLILRRKRTLYLPKFNRMLKIFR